MCLALWGATKWWACSLCLQIQSCAFVVRNGEMKDRTSVLFLKAKTKHSECDCFTVSHSQQLTWFTWSVLPCRPQKLLHKLLSLLLFLLLTRWVIKYQLTGFILKWKLVSWVIFCLFIDFYYIWLAARAVVNSLFHNRLQRTVHPSLIKPKFHTSLK